MSDTPRIDAAFAFTCNANRLDWEAHPEKILINVAKDMERELYDATARAESARQRIAELTEENEKLTSKLANDVIGYGLLTIRCDELTARAEAAERDAARYRWLRDERMCINVNFAMTMGWRPEHLNATQVDAAIDAALAAAGEKGE